LIVDLVIIQGFWARPAPRRKRNTLTGQQGVWRVL